MGEMAGKTIAAHIDEDSAERLRLIAETEARAASQLVAVGTRLVLDLSPAARRALIALDASRPEERAFVARLLGRAALKAREQVVAGRTTRDYQPLINLPLDTEDAIEAEAVAASRP
jgi:hypothetical protein